MMQKILLVVFIVLNYYCSSQGQSAGYKIGDKATDFSLIGIDEKSYSLSNYKDARGFIIVFTCNSCPFAVMYEDRINELAKNYKKDGYYLLAINPNDPEVKPEDSFENMKKRAQEKKFVFPYVFDKEQKIFPQYGATKTPHVYLLDKDLIVRYIGSVDDNPQDESAVQEKYLENAISSLKMGEKPNPEITKAIGCSIKIKK